MKNFEKFETEIMRITSCGSSVAVVKGVPQHCNKTDCKDCDFHGCRNCVHRRFQWFYEEYKERPKLTKKERKFLELLEGKDVWFATEKDSIHKIPVVYTEKPVKNASTWSGSNIITQSFRLFIDVKFDFIKWEDKEPWHISELLKLEVEE